MNRHPDEALRLRRHLRVGTWNANGLSPLAQQLCVNQDLDVLVVTEVHQHTVDEDQWVVAEQAKIEDKFAGIAILMKEEVRRSRLTRFKNSICHNQSKALEHLHYWSIHANSRQENPSR